MYIAIDVVYRFGFEGNKKLRAGSDAKTGSTTKASDAAQTDSTTKASDAAKTGSTTKASGATQTDVTTKASDAAKTEVTTQASGVIVVGDENCKAGTQRYCFKNVPTLLC